MCQIVLSLASVDEFSREWMVFKSNYPLTSLSRQKIHIIRPCMPCQAMNWTWSDNRNFPKLAKNIGKHAVKWLPAADRKHVNTSCGDTVKFRLDAGKSPIFRSQSPCTYIYVQESQRFWDFVRIRTKVRKERRYDFLFTVESFVITKSSCIHMLYAKNRRQVDKGALGLSMVEYLYVRLLSILFLSTSTLLTFT